MIQTQSDGSPITQAFIDAASQPFVGYDVKLYSGGVDTGWGIQRLSVQLGAGASQGDAFEDFALGGLQCSQMEGTLYDVAADPVGSEVELRVGVEVSEGAYEYVTVANMTVTSAKEWQGITTFTAAGFGFKLNAPLGISGDLSPQQIATAVEAACGVPVALGAFSALPEAVPVGEGATCRRAIEELALRCAGYACETAAGGVMVAPFETASTCSIREDIITAAPEVGEEWQADGLTVTAAEAEYTYGTGRVKASVPEATQQIADLMWGNLTGYAYTPARIRVAVADPRITPFDVMAVPYGQGTVNVPARGIELTCDGGYFGTFSAAGLTAEAEEALVEGEVTRDVRMAKEAAEEAQAVADAVNQHFWTDQQGIHVTEIEQDEFVEDPSGANILENANGILLRDGETWLSQFTPGSVAFYDGEGNEAENVTAVFGTDGAMIGKSGESHQLLDYHSMRLVDRGGDSYFHISDLRNENGIATITDTFINYAESQTLFALSADTAIAITEATINNTDVSPLPTLEYNEQVKTTYAVFAAAPPVGRVVRITYTTSSSYAKAFTLGKRIEDPAAMSFVVGYECAATGAGSYAEGEGTTAVGRGSHAEGGSTYASGLHSHAEGLSTGSRGIGSHAEGNRTNASGEASHAEGTYAVASGEVSHAEGYDTIAQAHATHAQNRGTVAASEAQTAIGRYNAEDANDAYALIVGNGTSSTRSNALTVAWDGSTTIGGSVSTDPSIQFVTENDNVNTRALIQAHDTGGSGGHDLTVRAGGNLVMGGGEYADNRMALGLRSLEETYIGADGGVLIESNAGTIANRKTWELTAGGATVLPKGGGLREQLSEGVIGTSDQTLNCISITDANGEYVSQFRCGTGLTGKPFTALVARKGAGDTLVQKVFYIMLDGTRAVYQVPDPANFRSAINASGALTARKTQVTLPANTRSVSCTAPAVSGYTFVCWLAPSTSGFVQATYMVDPTSATTNCYLVGDLRSSASTINVSALYARTS